MENLKIGFVGMVNVTGEQHGRASQTTVIPAHRQVGYRANRKRANPDWVVKTVPETTKEKVVKTVQSITVEFPAGEGIFTDSKIGLAYDLAFRMHADGLKNVRLWDYDGTTVVITGKMMMQARKVAAKLDRFQPKLKAAA